MSVKQTVAEVEAAKRGRTANDGENMTPTGNQPSPGSAQAVTTKVPIPGQHNIKDTVELTIVNR